MATTPTATKEQVEQRVLAALEEFGAEPSELAPEARFEALEIDSLDLVELAQIVEEEFGVVLKGDDMKGLLTVGQAVDLIAARAS
jgi:acyl carrier protein